MSDEEVIKRRLLIDGDGTGDDRRLNVLIKTFIKWVNTNDTPENTQAGYDRILSTLAQCEFAVTKSDFSSKMMKQELKNYEAISETIDSGIDHAKAQIEQSKENLVLAKKIRKNRMEYDVLAKIITQQPDRKKTTEKLEALKTELSDLENSRRQIQRKLEIRRSEFTVLMRSIKELQSKLDDDSEAEVVNDGVVLESLEDVTMVDAVGVTDDTIATDDDIVMDTIKEKAKSSRGRQRSLSPNDDLSSPNCSPRRSTSPITYTHKGHQKSSDNDRSPNRTPTWDGMRSPNHTPHSPTGDAV